MFNLLNKHSDGFFLSHLSCSFFYSHFQPQASSFYFYLNLASLVSSPLLINTYFSQSKLCLFYPKNFHRFPSSIFLNYYSYSWEDNCMSLFYLFGPCYASLFQLNSNYNFHCTWSMTILEYFYFNSSILIKILCCYNFHLAV